MAITYASNKITISGSYASGTATSKTANTLTDSTKSWTPSVVGTALGSLGFRQVWAFNSGGTLLGIGHIKSNTETVITLWEDWKFDYTQISTYVIGYAPRDVISAQAAYVSDFSGGDIAAPDCMLIDTDTDIEVASGGYYGSCGSPTHIWQYSYRDLGSVAGAHICMGRLLATGYAIEGGMFSFGLNVADPTSSGKYSASYHLISDEGDSRYYGCSFVAQYDFYYDAGTAAVNRRCRYDATTSGGDGKTFIDCKSIGVSINVGDGDTFIRVEDPNANLHKNVALVQDLQASLNFGLNPTQGGDGAIISDIKHVGSPDGATRVTGRPVFLYQWKTTLGNPCNYLNNLVIQDSNYNNANIVKAFQFDLSSTSNAPDGCIWLG